MSFKKIIFCLCILVSFQGHAKNFLVVINNEYDQKIVDIPELNEKDTFENDDFKIVYKKENEAIKINNSHSLIQLKAATVFYHLTIAKQYFIKLMEENFPTNIKPLTIRIDIENVYDVKEKYLDKLVYNTALSIPPSLANAKENWGHEIWFRPGKFEFKKITTNELVEQGVKIYDALVKSNHYIETLKIVDKVIKENTDNIEDDIKELSSGFAVDKVNRFLLEFFLTQINYGIKLLDTALNNEVIYHEYTHIVLSNYISIRSPLSLAEGIASFYATQISQGTDIVSAYSFHSLNEGKHAFTDAVYSPNFEKELFAQHEFSYSLFFQMGKILDDDFDLEYKSGSYFFNIIKELDPDGPIKVYPDFTNRLIRACKYQCKNPFSTKIKLNGLMQSLGM